jgi:cell wall-associated protease
MIKNTLRFVLWCLPMFLYSQTSTFNQFKSDNYNWWKLNQNQDSLAGTDWNKAITYLHQKAKFPKQQIIIAVLDSDFDLNHKMLKPVMWSNKNEIKGNKIDDDKNGYIDDYSGWNFLGIKNKDSSLAYVLTEETRILRKIDRNSFNTLRKKNKIPFQYNDVRASYDSTLLSLERKIKYNKDIEANYTFVIDTLRKLIKGKISLKNLSNFIAANDTIKSYVDYAKYYYEANYPYDEFIKYVRFKELSLEICMNLNYDNRSLLQKAAHSKRNKKYGTHTFGKNTAILEHGTLVSGVIAYSMLDSVSLIHNNLNKNYPINIMPITFTGIGDFTDKDFYVSIKYAVDNGVHIINLSQGKAFSIQPKILKKALSYAEKKNILVVISAGNESQNLDKDWQFPQSIAKLYKKEFSNVLIVGATTKKYGEDLVDQDSNYGLNSIDIFAPGVDILTCSPNNQFTNREGTSFAAPIVANIAALLWSHYPNLKASQIRKIIMDSGTPFNGLVNVPYDDEKEINDENFKPKQLFQNLSKSGKIVNAYNALLMAEQLHIN